jgi:transposase
MACDAREFRSPCGRWARSRVVPSRRGSKQPQPCPNYIYRHRNLIERCWSRPKEWQAIATRYGKTATSYPAGIAISIECEQTLAKLKGCPNATNRLAC